MGFGLTTEALSNVIMILLVINIFVSHSLGRRIMYLDYFGSGTFCMVFCKRIV